MNKNKFTRLGFILAAAGSAVGLGNIWKFPYITGDNGGGVFVLVYLLTVVFIGMSIFLAEVVMGSTANKDSVGTIETLAPEGKKYWSYTGFTFLTGLLILSFYAIVIGWILNYIIIAITALPTTVAESETVFLGLLKEDSTSQIIYYTLAFIFVSLIVAKGIKKGIERWNNILMPGLLIILVVMFFYSMTLDGFKQAIEFMFYPNFEKFHSNSILIAVGHAFFTLSLGMATITTYASSLGKEVNIAKAALSVVALDTIIAIGAGIIIFSVVFTAGQEPGKGAGLVFITLPAIFYEMGSIGSVMAIGFFIALAFAAITSSVSILEPTVMYLVERRKMNRVKATLMTSLIVYCIGIIALLSNTKEFADLLTFGSKNVFDWFDFITASILLPIGGIFIALFVGYIMDREQLRNRLVPFIGEPLYKIWLMTIRYLAPIAIFILMLNETGIIKFE